MNWLIHHDKITAKHAPNNGEGDSGSFDIIETKNGFSVVEGGYYHADEIGSLEEATTIAQREADAFDRRAERKTS